tara:strand:- start:520 stop:672 length:153 start_codon:yes stop_codon:yes gene_type:complete
MSDARRCGTVCRERRKAVENISVYINANKTPAMCCVPFSVRFMEWMKTLM